MEKEPRILHCTKCFLTHIELQQEDWNHIRYVDINRWNISGMSGSEFQSSGSLLSSLWIKALRTCTHVVSNSTSRGSRQVSLDANVLQGNFFHYHLSPFCCYAVIVFLPCGPSRCQTNHFISYRAVKRIENKSLTEDARWAHQVSGTCSPRNRRPQSGIHFPEGEVNTPHGLHCNLQRWTLLVNWMVNEMMPECWTNFKRLNFSQAKSKCRSFGLHLRPPYPSCSSHVLSPLTVASQPRTNACSFELRSNSSWWYSSYFWCPNGTEKDQRFNFRHSS